MSHERRGPADRFALLSAKEKRPSGFRHEVANSELDLQIGKGVICCLAGLQQSWYLA
jgi:hypothetical protein